MRQDIATETAYTLPARVRSYEVSRNGTVGIGTILRYLEFLATEASSALDYPHEWYAAHRSAWLVREMRVLLGDLPGIGAELRLGTWLSEWRKVQAFREYAVWRPETGRLVARGRARWAYVDLARGLPQRVPDEMVARFSPLGPPMRPSSWSPAEPSADLAVDGKIADLRLTAREVEADVNQHINNCVYADWLTEALTAALATSAVIPSGFTARPREYRLEYLRPTLPGEQVRVETLLARQGTRALIAQQRVLHEASGTPLLRALSRHLLLRPPV
ncbi:MAG TPA: thioesterase family protein [Ktedonobacterales bacterium]|nr:thioesterase family protein [Ktedonobacterales bacterium]